jgi:predicted dehydrogenase
MADAEITAVGSRTQESADAFGKEFNVPKRHPSYEALANDPEVDLIYVATPHNFHKENSILCMEAGKGVLCEKPFTINRAEAEEVIAVAEKQGVFLMEAMWTRYIPAIRKAMQWIEEGVIGDVRMVRASFGFHSTPKWSPRLFDPANGGGSLLDVGIYPITIAHLAFGSIPTQIQGLATIGATGVDELAVVTLGFEGGGLATLSSSITNPTPYDAHIMGAKGVITLHAPFWEAAKLSLTLGESEPEESAYPLMCNGYEYEAIEAQECFRVGKLQSDLMPHTTTLEVIDIMDELRAQWGLKYPME